MGYYIETDGVIGKANYLVDNFQAERIQQPISLTEIPEEKAVICVVSNGLFEAAGLCYHEGELEAFSLNDGRPKEWLLMDKDIAHREAGYKER